MSAQAGIWNFSGRPIDQRLFAKFGLAMNQYVSDGDETYISGPIGMKYRAFHTTVESRLERQPYRHPSGLIITWDGRLDNREDLLAQLDADVLHPQTDMDIAAAAFVRWGTDCFQRLRGDWALSIWDPDSWRLVLATDYAGIRHLYYCMANERVIWCTGLEPILSSAGLSFSLDDDYIAGFLVAYPDAGHTPYREIRSVRPGSFVQFRGRNVIVQSFWNLHPWNRTRYRTDSEYEEHFRYVFRQAVRRRLRADSPILADLSGGLDSSSIVCIADDIIASGEASPPALETLSFYCPSETTEDDRPFFATVERKRGKQGRHIKVEEFGGSSFLNYTRFIAVPGSLGNYSAPQGIQEPAQQQLNSRVRLSGIGGDEFLGGVPDPRSQLADLVVLVRPIELARQLIAWSSAKRIPWIQLLLQTLIQLSPSQVRAWFSKNAMIPCWIDRGFARRHKLAKRRLWTSGGNGFWLPSRREYAQTIHAVICQMTHRLSAPAEPVEARYPYLDQDLVEFLASIPASQLLRPGERRSLMRRALTKFLPSEVVQRRSKALGSRLHILALNSHKEELEKLFESPFSSHHHYIDRDRFLQQLRAANTGNRVQVVPAMRTISLELWLRDLVLRGVIGFPAAPHSAETEKVKLGV